MPSHLISEALRTRVPETRTVLSLDGSQETIIVGAGIAGLACARRLHDARHPFLMIAENMGGRIQRSRDGAVNLGAYYVRADYTHVRDLLLGSSDGAQPPLALNPGAQ